MSGTVNNMLMGLGLWLMFHWTVYALVQQQDVEEGHLDV
jgi:hypothetical protein